MTAAPLFLVVSLPGDVLSEAVRGELSRRELPHAHVAPGDLAALPVVISEVDVSLWGRPVHGVLWRATDEPEHSLRVPEPDRSFAAYEVQALWSAVLDRPDVFAVPKPPAEQWLSRARWVEWRRHLDAVGVPVSPLTLGAGAPDATWHPYTRHEHHPAPGAHLGSALLAATGAAPHARCVVGGGEVCEGTDTPLTRRVATWLAYWGAGPCEVTLDDAGAVLRVDPATRLSRRTGQHLALSLVDAYRDHLAGR